MTHASPPPRLAPRVSTPQLRDAPDDHDSCTPPPGLRRVSLRHSCVTHLVLCGCKGLDYVRLACPGLKQLELEECSDLTTVLLQPVGLEHLVLGGCCYGL